MRRRQIGLLQGEFLEADKVQALQRGVRLGLAEAREGLPQRKEIEPGAEAGFRHHQQRARVSGETLRQPVAVQKDIAGFFQPILIGKIDVIKLFRNRCTLFVPG
ncbi:Uncharacterised protein [Serratia marcescens]|nr:Uncharacterised protein [Serratia marcescens]